MERSLDKDRKALMEDLYLAEMANPVNETDKKLIDEITEVTKENITELESPHYYPIGIIDSLRKSKRIHFGNTVTMPAIQDDLDAIYNDSNEYISRIYYLGFIPNEKFIPKKEILTNDKLKELGAKRIAVSKAFVYHVDDKPEIIISSIALNKKNNIKPGLTWIAYYGFAVKPEQNEGNNDSNSTNQENN